MKQGLYKKYPSRHVKSEVRSGYAEMGRNTECFLRVQLQHWHAKWSIRDSQMHEWAKAPAGYTVHGDEGTVLNHSVAGPRCGRPDSDLVPWAVRNYCFHTGQWHEQSCASGRIKGHGMIAERETLPSNMYLTSLTFVPKVILLHSWSVPSP